MDRGSNSRLILRFATLGVLLMGSLAQKADAQCSTPSGVAGARNYAVNKMQMCDGSNWVDFLTDGTMGACSTAGQVEWDSTAKAFKACYSTTWNKIKLPSSCTVSALTYQNKVTDATNLALVATMKISDDGTKLYASPMYSGRLSIWSTTAAPAAPTLLGAVAHANLTDTTDSVIVGNYAYVAARDQDNVVVIDVSNPAAPSYVTRVQTSPISEMANVWGITASGNYLYTVSWDSGAGLNKCFLNVFDISTPSAPVEVGSLNVSDAGAGATERYCNKIVVKENVALITFGEGFLAAVNVATPSAPTWITKVNATNGTNIDTIALSDDRNTLFAASFSTSRIHSFNISTPSAPTWISSVLNSTYFNGAYGLVVSGNYAFSGGQNSDAVAVINVSNPASMTVGANATSATNLNGPGPIQRNGRYLFVATIDGNGISVVDVGCDPTTGSYGACSTAGQQEYFPASKTLAWCDGSQFRAAARGCVAGSVSFTNPGTSSYTIPVYTGTLTVNVWGGGGGGGGDTSTDGAGTTGNTGGTSSFGTVIANGGAGGNGNGSPPVGGAGGTASGGTTNTTGAAGANGSSGTGGTGGNAPGGGGTGGGAMTTSGVPGNPGNAPGGGGGGSYAFSNGASGGGSGGYSTRAYAAGGISGQVTVTVGGGGTGIVPSLGAVRAKGGDGARGQVDISWTCSP